MAKTYVKAVLFDLDGTLIDTAADFVRILRQMGAELGWQVPRDAEIREQVSAGASAMVKLMLRDTAPEELPDEETLLGYRQAFLDAYERDICVDSVVFAELLPYLDWLEKKGIPWGIVTNKPRYLSELLLEKLNLHERCQVLVCPDDVTRTKPDPEPMYLAMEKLKLPRGVAGSVIYVGDHIRDIQAGNAAGMITVLAGYGYIPPEDQADLTAWQADHLAMTPGEVVDLLQSDAFDYL